MVLVQVLEVDILVEQEQLIKVLLEEMVLHLVLDMVVVEEVVQVLPVQILRVVAEMVELD